ncbi:hypothetical protein CWE15_08495 [Aliidiomarina taiwanensis]|uniref:Endonuclease/exonuclease/phosphatase domain-containing protein n=1 Tax=Aliidiomarina taiwanensis TaxID=946228 RepID=A0A432X0X3_9GAMM|nr:ExeM/NucH family extracellular endonuclease [Aliidiomarina taiwanensis]RUO39788.1 hypothetical protein CWE15_08495 [Aliidiomarina taiwanensis]
MLSFYRALLALCLFTILSACNSTPSTDTTPLPIAERCGAPATDIAALGQQAPGHYIVEGVVSASFQEPSQLGGFFIQSPAHMATSATPAAMFIHYSSTASQVREGDRVRIEGEKTDYSGGVALHNVTSFTRCSRNETVSTQTLALPFEYVAQLDALLHQRVRLAQPMTVVGHYQLARFGTLDLATERLWVPTQISLPGPGARDLASDNLRRRIVLDDGSDQENPDQVPYPTPGLHIDNPVRSGDTVYDIEGVLVKIGDAYHIHPVSQPRFEATNPRPAQVELPQTGDIRIAAFNVLNYFNGDATSGGFPTPRGAKTEAEFVRQRDRIIQALVAINADVYGLMEMANNGYTSESAVADLTRGMQAAAPQGVLYDYVRVDSEKVGGDVITQAIIYRADKLDEIGQAAFIDTPPFDMGSRPPLAQSFKSRSTGAEFTLVANHFKSKGSCPRDMQNPNRNRNDGQGCWNQLRTESATALANWLRTFPTGRAHRNYIVLGDFNAYAMEDPLMELRRNGYRNVANRLQPEGYSYVFRGEMGSLDHILVHSSVYDAVTGLDFWHINADEPVAFEYGLSHKTPEQQQDWYAPTPYRSSDHDPVIIEINSALLPE